MFITESKIIDGPIQSQTFSTISGHYFMTRNFYWHSKTPICKSIMLSKERKPCKN